MDEEAMKKPDFEEEFEKVKSKFEKCSNRVFKILANFKSYYQSSPHLAQLLLRIDYNDFFSRLSDKIEKEETEQLLANRGGLY